MDNKCFIYVLKNPINNKIRYVGKSRNLKQRFKNHINKCRDKNTHKRNWINKLIKDGLKPIMEMIEETNNDNWKEREKYWIKYYTDKGCKLVNHTEGGDGLTFGNQTSFKKGDGNKKVISLKTNGNIFKIFPSIKDANLYFDLNGGNLGGTLNKSRKTCKGYIWLYYEEYTNMSSDELLEHIKWANDKIKKPNKTSFSKGHDINSKKVYQYTKSFKLIKEWKSCSEASRKLSLNNIAIGNCARQTTKSSGGFYWSYKKIK